ncbi:MAG: hypothetical protein EON57_17355, partial [Alphaproteobacteria bacterium]
MKSLVSVALVAAFTLSTAAFAQESSEKQDKDDPNRMICKAEEQIGTRLSKKKTCMTAAQWKEARRLSRMEIDRNQSAR